jgi:protease IV
LLGRTVRGVFGFAWRLLDGLRRTVHLFLMLLVLAAVLVALASRPARLPESFVLVVGPEGVLVEQYSGHPLERAIETA